MTKGRSDVQAEQSPLFPTPLAAGATGVDSDSANEHAGGDDVDLTVMHPDPVASVFTTSINIISNVVGAGILAIPSSLATMSLVPGMLLLTLFACLSSYSMVLLTLCAQRTGRYSYKDLIQYATGSERFGRLFDGAIFIYTYGCTIGYCISVGDSMSSVMEQFFDSPEDRGHALTKKWLWMLLASGIFFPLSSLKQLSELKVSSAFGFGVIVYLVLIIVVYFFDPQDVTAGNPTSSVDPDFQAAYISTKFLRAAPLASVGFSCHYNIPPFYGEMKNRSPTRMFRAVLLAVPVIYIIYTIAGVFSVLHFPKEKLVHTGDVSENFPSSYTPMTVARISLFIHFVCVYPIVCIASRRALNFILFNRGNMSQRVYIIEAFCLVATSTFLAILVNKLSTVFDLIGAMFGISIVVVIPNVLYLLIIPKERTAVSGPNDRLEDAGVEKPLAPSSDEGTVRKGAGYDGMNSGAVAVNAEDEDRMDGAEEQAHPLVAALDQRLHFLNDLVEVQHPLMQKAGYVFAVFGIIMSIAGVATNVQALIQNGV